MPGHVPILSVLGAGTVKVVQLDGEDHYVDITGGFLSLDHDMVTIVAEPVDAG
jgi:F-type H+-transporting ATPase subunit epsilon